MTFSYLFSTTKEGLDELNKFAPYTKTKFRDHFGAKVPGYLAKELRGLTQDKRFTFGIDTRTWNDCPGKTEKWYVLVYFSNE